MRARAEAAESHLLRASLGRGESAAGLSGLHPLISSALSDTGFEASVLSIAEHIGPVQRLNGSSLEGERCVIAKPNPAAVPALAAYASRLAETKTRDSYTFYSAAEYLSGLVVSDRHNLRVARRGGAKNGVAAGACSSVLVPDVSYCAYRPDFRVVRVCRERRAAAVLLAHVAQFTSSSICSCIRRGRV